MPTLSDVVAAEGLLPRLGMLLHAARVAQGRELAASLNTTWWVDPLMGRSAGVLAAVLSKVSEVLVGISGMASGPATA